MCWLTTAAPGVVNVKVFLSSAPQPSTGGPEPASGIAAGTYPRARRTNRFPRQSADDRVVDAHEDAAVVVEKAVGEGGQNAKRGSRHP